MSPCWYHTGSDTYPRDTLDVEQSESTLLLPIGVGKAVADTLSHCFAANSALQKRG